MKKLDTAVQQCEETVSLLLDTLQVGCHGNSMAQATGKKSNWEWCSVFVCFLCFSVLHNTCGYVWIVCPGCICAQSYNNPSIHPLWEEPAAVVQMETVDSVMINIIQYSKTAGQVTVLKSKLKKFSMSQMTLFNYLK